MQEPKSPLTSPSSPIASSLISKPPYGRNLSMQVKRLRCHLGSLNIPFQLCSKLALGIITSEEVIETSDGVIWSSEEVIGSLEEVIETSEEVTGSSKEVIGPQRRL